MIEIITLFFGLYHGMQSVELAVGDEVAEVELWLNGETVGELRQPPWTLRIDLGEELQPHELTAVARDAGGGELGRARRWVNLEAAPPAEESDRDTTAIAVTLEKGTKLPPTREMHSWFSVDGEPLDVLRVAEGGADVMIVRDPAVQSYLDRVAAFFIRLQLPVNLEGDEVPLTDKKSFVAASRAALLDRGEIESAQRAGAVWERWNVYLDLGDDVDVRFISPRAAPVSKIASRMQIFSYTKAIPSRQGGVLWHTAQNPPLHFVPRISDAVAIAGLEAHAGLRRRAVLLLLTDEAMGRSRHPPAAVRKYLEALRVPLFVWRFEGNGPLLERLVTPAPSLRAEAEPAADPADWGTLRTLTYPETLHPATVEAYLFGFEAAAKELRESLRRQRVVLLRGAHLPNRIRLSDEAVGITMVGAP